MGKRILVIDGEPVMLDRLRRRLVAMGYEVLAAADGARGLESFARERPDIVLADAAAPVLDGMEALRRIKALDPQVEVVLSCDGKRSGVAARALNLDAADLLARPLEPGALGQALARVEARQEAARRRGRDIELAEEPGAAVLRLRGGVTAQSEPFLARALGQARALGRACVVLHFARGASANGAGLSVLIRLLREARGAGVCVRLRGFSGGCLRAFDAAGLSGLAESRPAAGRDA